jgi:Fe-S cluster assembly protein SufB
MDDNKKKIDAIIGDYQYGFKTETTPFYSIPKGISEEVVTLISQYKKEPQWMTDIRIKAYREFVSRPNPTWGPDLSFINFDEFTYFIKSSERAETSWDDVPEEIKDTFEKLGIPEAERKYLAGVSTQFESEVVYHSTLKELEDLGVIYVDTDTALREYPDLVKQYFGTTIPYNDNK